MGVSFKELAGSPLETYGPEGMKAERRILVAWEDRHAIVAELLGDGYEFGGAGRAAYPERAAVVAMRVKLEPWPKSPEDQGAFTDITSDLNSYSGKYTQIAIDYQLLAPGELPEPMEFEEGTFLTYRMDFGGEYEALSGESFRWQYDESIPVPPDAVPKVRVPIAEHHLTWHRVINPPWGAIRNCSGKVNNAAFLGAPAETVLLDGAVADKEFIFVDELRQPQFGWRIAYVFREKSVKVLTPDGGSAAYGWNHRYRSQPPGNPGWDRLSDAQGNSLYPTADFSTLFQFAALA